MGQGNGKGKLEIKMLPSHGRKRVLHPLRAQFIHNLMENQRVLPTEKNTQNKFHQGRLGSFKILAVAPDKKCPI